jgi:hypothetical protein
VLLWTSRAIAVLAEGADDVCDVFVSEGALPKLCAALKTGAATDALGCAIAVLALGAAQSARDARSAPRMVAAIEACAAAPSVNTQIIGCLRRTKDPRVRETLRELLRPLVDSLTTRAELWSLF